MKMPIKFFGKYLAMLDKQNIVINAIGRLDELPKKTSNCIIDAIEKTRNNTGLVCTIAINYGSRDDIVRAVNRLIEKGTAIDEHDFAKTLSTGNLPEVDLLVRTSGEKRLSNFLLWELSYAEFIFTKTMWPDYDANELMNSIGEFSSRNIRKGGL